MPIAVCSPKNVQMSTYTHTAVRFQISYPNIQEDFIQLHPMEDSVLEVLVQPLHHGKPPLAYLPSHSSLLEPRVEVIWELLEADKQELGELMDLGNNFHQGFATSFPTFQGKSIVLPTSIEQRGSGTWIPTLEWLKLALDLEKAPGLSWLRFSGNIDDLSSG